MKKMFLLMLLSLMLVFTGCGSSGEEEVDGDVDTKQSVVLPTEVYPYINIDESSSLKYILRDNSDMDTYIYSSDGVYVDRIDFILDGTNTVTIDLNSDGLPSSATTPEGNYSISYDIISQTFDGNFTSIDGTVTQKVNIDYSDVISRNIKRDDSEEPGLWDRTVNLFNKIFSNDSVSKINGKVSKGSYIDRLQSDISSYKTSTNYNDASCDNDTVETNVCKEEEQEYIEAYRCLQVYQYGYPDTDETYSEEDCKEYYLTKTNLGYLVKSNIANDHVTCNKNRSRDIRSSSSVYQCKFINPEHKEVLNTDDCIMTNTSCEEVSLGLTTSCFKEVLPNTILAQTTVKETKKCYSDSDGDGVIDEDDKCPNTLGLTHLLGCPDDDGDNIPNSEDSCPDNYGLIENNGCPENDVIVLNLTDKRTHYSDSYISIAPNSKAYYNVEIADIGKFHLDLNTYVNQDNYDNIKVYFDDESLEVAYGDAVYTEDYIEENEYIMVLENNSDTAVSYNFTMTLTEFDDQDNDGVWDGEDICMDTPSFLRGQNLVTNDGCAKVSSCPSASSDWVPVGHHYLQTSANSGFICTYTTDERKYLSVSASAYYYEGESPYSKAPLYDGDYTYYISTGIKRYIPYNMGIMDGVVKEYYDNGVLADELTYVSDKICGSITYHQSGGIAIESIYDQSTCEPIRFCRTCEIGGEKSCYDGTQLHESWFADCPVE